MRKTLSHFSRRHRPLSQVTRVSFVALLVLIHPHYTIWGPGRGYSWHYNKVWEQAQDRLNRIFIGNLEPDLLAGEGGWVANRPVGQSEVKGKKRASVSYYTHLHKID